MSIRRHITAFRHPALSLWQSSLHRVLARRAAEGGPPGATGLAASVDHPAMDATVDAVPEEVDSHEEVRSLTRHGRARENVCARRFVQMALARFHGNVDEVERLRSELRFESCDPLWFETWLEYERTLLLRREHFYRRHASLDDFVLPALPDDATVALLADWGTGMPDAQALLEQVASFHPDAIFHLGDIYYSGTPHEVRAHFLDVVDRVFPGGRPRLFSLAGNHDRYSGGEGYRQLLEALGQPASYFCLRTRSWQFLAMDTGLHDRNPRALSGNVTRLEDTEAAWLLDKVRRAGEGSPTGRRGTVLLSHHQLFAFASVGRDAQGRPLAVNPDLYAVFAPVLGEVDLWFWGHEHNLLLYAPYAGLARGRCLGAGAVPNIVHEQHNRPRPGLVLLPGASAPPHTLPGTRLGNDGVVENHCFAILRLEGPRLTVRYYQASSHALVPHRPHPPAPPFFEESVTLGPG
jgi:Calcineurin-like phosphoesterase